MARIAGKSRKRANAGAWSRRRVSVQRKLPIPRCPDGSRCPDPSQTSPGTIGVLFRRTAEI